MQITQINGYGDGSYTLVDVTVNLGDMPVSGAVSSILALLSGAAPAEQVTRTRTAVETPAATVVEVPGASASAGTPPAEQVTRTRTRTRAAPAAAAEPITIEGVATETAPANAADAGVRRRRNTDQPATDAKPSITDADLSKAASNAAATKGVGQEVVLAVIGDFGVKTVGDVKAEDRERFLKELAEEVRLAEEEAASTK